MLIRDRNPVVLAQLTDGVYYDHDGDMHVPFQQDRRILLVSISNSIELDPSGLESSDTVGLIQVIDEAMSKDRADV